MLLKFVQLTVTIMLLFLGLVWIIPSQVVSYDGPATIDRLAIQQYDGGLRFYNVDDSGQFTLLLELSDFGIRQDTIGYYQWEVMYPSNIVISPDGQRFAFTAVGDLNPETITLFIYTLGDSDLHEVLAPTLGELQWSPLAPNHDAILITPLGRYINDHGLESQGVHLYTLSSNTMTTISEEPRSQTNIFAWLPNGREFIYSLHGPRCEAPCIFVPDLHSINISDLSDTRLTDLTSQLPPNLIDIPIDTCRILTPKWSVTNQRYYYVVRCNVAGNSSFRDLIYSIDISGNNRLEADFITAYPDDETMYISTILPSASSTDVYAVASGRTHRETNGYTWRVYRVTSAGQREVVLEDNEANFYVSTARLSPNGRWIVISGSDPYLTVVDMVNGETTYLSGPSSSVFIPDWLDGDRLLVTEAADGLRLEPTGTQILNITTGERINITDNMDGLVWIIPKRETPRLLP